MSFMKINSFITCVVILMFSCFAMGQNLQSPKSFLGEDYGVQFSAHHQLVDYFQHVAENSDRISMEKYGETNEGRPLYLVFVSSVNNQKNLENIRQTNLYNAGLVDKAPTNISEKGIVWLSYSVHGNEAGGSESSMNVVYQLAKGGADIDAWLEEVVVIMDPSLNPDGYSRYTHWVKGVSGKRKHPELTDVEHMEPWPGGRVNHYLFDLNRDWAWQTQVETQQRIKMYNQWMPHVHADLHEMGFDDHYYFAPAAEPFHKAITDWQREFQFEIGKNHAQYFDKNGWLYFTREIFDLLYPSYGDTWPTFNGSIGMTYEQAGHGMSGRSIRLGNGKDLVLQDRIDHHSTTSLSTIEITANNRAAVIENFKEYYSKSIKNPVGKHQYYIVKKGELTQQFADLLDKNGIVYSYVDNSSQQNGYSYQSKKNKQFQTDKGDIYISAYQPKSTLLQVFMEEEPVLADSVTYDITSWCIPLAYQLECYAFKTAPEVSLKNTSPPKDSDSTIGSYGLSVKWNNSFDSKVFLSRALQMGYNVKSAQKEIDLGAISISRGDLVLLKFDQKNYEQLEKDIDALTKDLNIIVSPLNTGFSISGNDLGGTSLARIEMPKVLTFFGNGVSANEYGQVWYYFENIIDYPISRVDINRFSRVDLSEFNTIILPDGYYSLSDADMDKLSEWVSNGGKLIAVAGGIRNLRSNSSFAIGNSDDEEMKEKMKKQREAQRKRDRVRKYEGAERRSIAGSIPGAIFKTELDNSHPLCFGMNHYYSLKNSSSRYPLLSNGSYNPVRIGKDYATYGFIGSNLKGRFEDTVVFGVESKGGGKIIYMVDNPLFRAFWRSGEIIFANALFQVQ